MTIAFSGKIGSGKTTLTTALATRLDWPRISFGDYVRSYAIEHHIEPTRENLQNIGERLLDNDAEQFCASVLSQVVWRSNGNLIIDGVRHISVLNIIKRLVNPFKFIHIHIEVDERTRIERLQSRYSSEQVLTIDNHSTEHDVKAQLKQEADIVLSTVLTTNEMIDQIVEVLGLIN
ncbi:AAA family ATPase [Rudanella lutea]|uniref:AAA family ATPase n=1 Tax=Rudanella lutea TaxID=451374 RepID=UPI00036DEFB9|nr:AAA family ATPase [Rudanella lutea]